MSIIFGLGVIIIQLLAYSFGIFVLFHEKIRNIRLAVFCFVICLAIYYVLSLSKGKMLYLQVSAIVILWVLIEGTAWRRSMITIKAVFIISCCEEMLEAVIALILLQVMNRSVSLETKFIVANLLLFLIWSVVDIVKKRNKKWPRKYINALIMIAMGVMAVALVLVTAGIQFAEPYVNDSKFLIASDILSIISYCGIVIFGLFIIYIKNANENYKHLLETESLLRKLQISNYELMLSKDEETRKFRHDIINHIMCLKTMIMSDNIAGADHYIEEMYTTIRKIQKKNYVTGNEIIDAVLNFYIQQLSENTEVSVVGV